MQCRPPRRGLVGPNENGDKHFHHPRGRFKSWKKNRRRLNEQPGNNRVGDRNLVNVAPLQLGKEVAVHGIRVGLRFERREISEITEVCILTLGHSCSRLTHASYPSCCAARTRLPCGSLSRLFMTLQGKPSLRGDFCSADRRVSWSTVDRPRDRAYQCRDYPSRFATTRKLFLFRPARRKPGRSDSRVPGHLR